MLYEVITAQTGLYIGILPVTDDHFAVQAHAAADETKFAVAMRGLVEVHEIHVDLRPRDSYNFV